MPVTFLLHSIHQATIRDCEVLSLRSRFAICPGYRDDLGKSSVNDVTLYVLPVAQGIWWLERRPGEAAEGLEKENDRLREAVSDLTLEKLILKEAASGNY